MSSTKLGRNVFIGVVSSALSAVLSILVVPLLLHLLGAEGYGLVTIYATVLALFLVLDFGLAPTINREVSISVASGSFRNVRNLLHTFSLFYWSVATVGGVTLMIAAPVIADHWLQNRALTSATVTEAIRLMVLASALRLPNGLYLGAAMGAQQFTKVSLINLAAAILSSVGAVLVLYVFPSSLRTYFIWQVLVAGCQVLAGRWLAWHHLPGAARPRLDLSGLHRTWQFSSGIALSALLAAIVMQIDKMLLPRFVSLSEVGFYGVAGLLARSLMVVIAPMFGALYPHFTLLAARNDEIEITKLYHGGTQFASAIIFPATAFGVIGSGALLKLWTGGHAPAIDTELVAPLLLFGMSLNGIMYFPHALQLAYGKATLPIRINLAMLVFGIPALLLLLPLYGSLGAAYSWVGMNAVNLVVGTWLTHRVILPSEARPWLLRGVVRPLVLSGLVAAIGSVVAADVDGIWPRLAIGVLTGAVAAAGVVAISPQLMETLRRFIIKRETT